jgi:hypothetical protein
VVLITLLVLVLLALLGVAGWLVLKALDHSDEPGVAYSPSEAVEEYLTALSQGDATTALLYSAAQPDVTTFTTNEFLAAMMASYPLTNVVVPEGQTTTSPADIQASYTLDGRTVQAEFRVQLHGRNWLLDGGFLTLDVTSLLRPGVPLTLNGLELAAGAIDLFPGVYTLASANPWLTLSHPAFTIEYPQSQPTFSQFSFELSDQAVADIRTAAQAKLDWCLVQQSINPDGCGFGFAEPAAGPVDLSTVTWTLGSDSQPLDQSTPVLEPGSLTSALAEVHLAFSFHAISVDQLHVYDTPTAVTEMRADLTDPTQVVITFGSFG